MRSIVTVQDDTAEIYKEEAKARKISVEEVLEDRIERAIRLDPRDRVILLTGKTREAVEEILGGGMILGELDLLQKVNRLARIKFGDHEIHLTAGQMEEMTWRARKQGKTIDQMIKEAYEKFATDFFTLVP